MQMVACIKGIVMYRLIQGVVGHCMHIRLWLVGYLGCVTPADGDH